MGTFPPAGGLRGIARGIAMRFSVGSELIYKAVRDTSIILNVEAQNLDGQEVLREKFSVSPSTRSESYEVAETGNRYRRLMLEAGQTYTVRYEAEVETHPLLRRPERVSEIPVAELPLGVMNHLFPSRYVESDQLGRFAWRRFGEVPEGHQRVDAICDWIHDNVDYLEGSSDGSTSAYDTFTTRAGVCRDFAHLGITFCRALGIPARFVSAYGWKLEPQDFHAVFEAYLDGRWYLFDPTRLSPPEGLIRIGIGRDAADTAFATYFGQLESEPKVVWVNEVGSPEVKDDRAVSLSAV
jgi:transglutaminase-like putative cysteine protease